MQGNPQIIDTLNSLLAGELTAVDQYLIHGEMYADMGLGQLAEKSLHESEHERQHARAAQRAAALRQPDQRRRGVGRLTHDRRSPTRGRWPVHPATRVHPGA